MQLLLLVMVGQIQTDSSVHVLQHCLLTEQCGSVSFWPPGSNEIIITSVEQYVQPATSETEMEYYNFVVKPTTLFASGQGTKAALLFPQSLFKPIAMSLETLLGYFSGYFNIVHAQLSSPSR